jgi:phosphoglycerate kinase
MAINKFNILENINYISTAGGAFLDYISGKKLPALEDF